MSPLYRKIGLLSNGGGRNLGNNATFDAIIHQIRIRCPNAEIIGFIENPQESEKNHGILSYAIRRYSKPSVAADVSTNSRMSFKARAKETLREYPLIYKLISSAYAITIRTPKSMLERFTFLIESFRILKDFDILIIPGRGELCDNWGGPWLFPYTHFKWILLAKLRNVKVFFLNVGAGPVDYRLGKLFIKYSLMMANYCSLRDRKSKSLIEHIGFKGRIDVYPDLAYGLEVDEEGRTPISERIRKVVGINPMPFGARVWPQKDLPLYQAYIQKLASFGYWLVKNDYVIALFGSDIGHDSLAIEDLRKAMKEFGGIDFERGQMIVHPITSVKELLDQMSLMDFVVTSRLHPVIFSHLLNKPVLAVAHHDKVSSLMKDMGFSEYCLNIKDFNVQDLSSKFQNLVQSEDNVKSQLNKILSCYQKELKTQLDVLFL